MAGSNSLAIKKELKVIMQRELDRLLIEGYQKTKAEDTSLNADWENATLETVP